MAKCAKCVKSAQLFFFEPSGGKSDAADPFSIVPKLSSAFLDNPSRRHRPSGLFNRGDRPSYIIMSCRPALNRRCGGRRPLSILKRPDGRCRRLGLSRNAELSFGTIENGSAASDLPPEGSKKKSWADLAHLEHFAKTKPRDYQKWIRDVRFNPRGSEKRVLG